MEMTDLPACLAAAGCIILGDHHFAISTGPQMGVIEGLKCGVEWKIENWGPQSAYVKLPDGRGGMLWPPKDKANRGPRGPFGITITLPCASATLPVS